MCLLELSRDYHANAVALKARILELEGLRRHEDIPEDLAWRIRTLTAMWREVRDLAVLCERYYERGYRRNDRYTL